METYLAMIVGNNFEEIEVVATIDVLRRAKIKVDLISLYNQPTLQGAHGIIVLPDGDFTAFEQSKYDGLIIPGGKGVDAGEAPLLASTSLLDLVKEFHHEAKLVAAVCAAPQVLGKAGILGGKKITHFPGSDQFLDQATSDLTKPSITDGDLITGASAGSAIQFALAIVEYYQGPDQKEALADQLVMNYR